MIPFRDGQILPGVEKQRQALRHCIDLLQRMEAKRKKDSPPVAEVTEVVVIRLTPTEKPRDAGSTDWDI